MVEGYKGFDKNLKCMNKQYELNKTFTEEKAELCHYGMHFCTFPLDCLVYYPSDCNISRYAKVRADDVIKGSEEDTKCVTKKLTIENEVDICYLAEASVEYIRKVIDNKPSMHLLENAGYKKCKNGGVFTNNKTCTLLTSEFDLSTTINTANWSISVTNGIKSIAINHGDYSTAITNRFGSIAVVNGLKSIAVTNECYSIAVSNSDYTVTVAKSGSSIAANSGFRSISISEDYNSIAANSNSHSVSKTTRYSSISATSDDQSSSINTGDKSVAVVSGNYSNSTNFGNESAAISLGYQSVASTTGKNSVAFAFGPKNIAKGEIDEWIILSEWDESPTNNSLKEIKAFKVDNKAIKANTFYRLVNGEPVIVNEEELKFVYCVK